MSAEFTNDEGPVMFPNEGTSEGAKKGWEARTGGGRRDYTDEAADKTRALKDEAEKSNAKAYHAEMDSKFEDHSGIASAHREAQSKYEAVAEHLRQFKGTDASVRLAKSKAAIHGDRAKYHEGQVKKA